MLFNLTEVNENTFLAANAAIHVLFFVILTLPTVILCGLAITALLPASTINWQMRASLLNIFVAEIVSSIAMGVSLLGYSVRALSDGINDIAVCRLVITLFIAVSCTKITSITLYAIMAYLFVKYDGKKLKWRFVLLCMLITWIFSISLGILHIGNLENVLEDSSFCVSTLSSVFAAALILAGLVTLSCAVVATTMAILAKCYVYHYPMDEDFELKGAIANSSFFLAFGMVLSAAVNLFALLRFLDSNTLKAASIVTRLILAYIGALLVMVPSLLTLVIAMIVLKPLRNALKKTCNIACSCCKMNVVHVQVVPTEDTN